MSPGQALIPEVSAKFSFLGPKSVAYVVYWIEDHAPTNASTIFSNRSIVGRMHRDHIHKIVLFCRVMTPDMCGL